MSAVLDTLPRFRPMHMSDLDAIMRIEPVLYSHPWARGNFEDSLQAGYSCWVMDCAGELIGYGVLMVGVREAHLLNISIAQPWQSKGYGRELLEHIIRIARHYEAEQLLLEVRPSNRIARALYAKAGFRDITVRRGYYPSASGREDAILMGLAL
jgi:ribosomal-protein-alanine N-acetyltransferase